MTMERLGAALADRYTLERELGRGGMATVYLAKDLKHDRAVAIKVLKPELAAVLGADRFVVEIKTTAALQHPHILPLFDSGESDGFLWYAMPFIDGETLRTRLDRETQLGVDEAVRITREVADALDYAHRHGVVHRDIKPENILLHDGRPMVADFGIALALSAAAGGRMTETGLSLGTPHYMSPEQATADKEITGRSDTYSLASVCYEMLTGNPPHTGSSAQQIIMKIVAEEAQPVSTLRKSVPRNVTMALAKALEKLPADRFATAREFAAALVDSSFATTTMGVAAASTRRWSALLIAGWTIALVAVAAAAWAWLRPEPSPQVLRYAMALPAEQRLGNVRGVRLALSPDGSRLAYVGDSGDGPVLMLRNRDQLDATIIPGTHFARNPTFSPDGTRLAFAANGGGSGLRVVGLTGAPPVTVIGSRVGADGLTWASDGNIYYDGLTQGGTVGLMRIGLDGGPPTQMTTIDTASGEGDHFWPVSLPDGRGILFTVESRNLRRPSQLAVLDLATGEYRILLQARTARYAASGHLIYVTDGGGLLAVSFDLDRLAVVGEPFVLASAVGTRAFGAVDLALSRSGTLVYTDGGQTSGGADIVSLTRSGEVTPIDTAWKSDFQTVAVSPDGTQLAAGLISGAEGGQVWVKSLPAGPVTKLTFEGTQNLRPAWHPNGRTVGYVSNRDGLRAFWSRKADGSTPAEPIVKRDSFDVVEAFWSADGEWLLSTDEAAEGVVHVRRTRGDTSTKRLVLAPGPAFDLALSPDSRWLAYSSRESGSGALYVRPFPDVESARWTVSTAGGWEPHWSHTGRELFFINDVSVLESVEVLPTPTFTVGKRETLMNVVNYADGNRSWDITPDDKHFVFIRAGADEDTMRNLVVVENVLQELRDRGGR